MLAMGLSPVPRQFTKLMKPVLAHLQKQGVTVSAYLDDLFLSASSLEQCAQDVRTVIDLLRSLGFAVNEAKSVTFPTQRISHLGFWIDSVAMQVSLTDDKFQKLQQRADALLSRAAPSIRQVMTFIGTVEACTVAVKHILHHKHMIEKLKNKALVEKHGKLNRGKKLSARARAEVRWWVNYRNEHPAPIVLPTIDHEMYMDASDEGGGMVFGDIETGGRWSAEEQILNINARELLAVEFGLKALFPNMHNVHIHVFTDNVTTVAFVRKMGGCRSMPCHNVAARIWDWAQARDIWISISHVSGINNARADKCSREFNDRTEWCLQPHEFRQAMLYFDEQPDIDLFASRLNKQLELYVSWNPDPDAWAVDAFSFEWTNHLFYAFPPFSLISRVLQKVVTDGARMLLVAPVWEAQNWWGLLQQLAIKTPYNLPRREDLIYLTFNKDSRHPLARSIKLRVYLISGKIYRTKD